MVLLVSSLKAQAQLEPVVQYWLGYSLSSTGVGVLFISLLARMPASTALADAHSRFTAFSGDVSCLHQYLDSCWVFSQGVTTSIRLSPVL